VKETLRLRQPGSGAALKQKTKQNPYCLHTLPNPNFNLAKKNNYASIDPSKYNRHNKNYS